MAGYVARDMSGSVPITETAPSARWDQVVYAKGAPFNITPVLTDGVVYADEMVNALVQRFGRQDGATGVRGYSLDNEPALWFDTHPRLHPSKVTYTELLSRSIALSQAINAVDSSAEVFGPAAYRLHRAIVAAGCDRSQYRGRWLYLVRRLLP